MEIYTGFIGAPPALQLIHDACPGEPPEQAHRGVMESVKPSEWNETELTNAILTLCDEFPIPRMVACWRAVEHCRQWTPRGTPESLLVAMRETLRRDLAVSEKPIVAAA